MSQFRYSLFVCCTLLALSGALPAGETEKPFVIHEWGTFTVLQDERGETLPGVNLNEESLPPFVYRLKSGVVSEGLVSHPLLRPYSKGLPSRWLLARMRMETPIIYIYPPTDEPQEIDVRVEFQGGWISEWFPHADVNAPGLNRSSDDPGVLSRDLRGSILWKNITTNSDQTFKETDQHVWLAPREVQAPALHATGGQAEKYLFYRGVANIEAPLRVQHDSGRKTYEIVRHRSLGSWEDGLHYRAMWLVDIAESGQAAYRRLDLSHQHSAGNIVSACDSEFSEQQYQPESLERLTAEMKRSLMAEGLFADEANAMLKTWELSYFKSPGRRLFFTLPRDWTDRILPLEVSRRADIERVMIGRVELITQRHRKILDRINNATISNPDWFYKRYDSLEANRKFQVYNSLANGSKQVTDFDFDVPDDFRSYLKLGRFREALITQAAKNENAKGLRQFAENYEIELR